MSTTEILSVISPTDLAVLQMFDVQPTSFAAVPRGGFAALYDAKTARPILTRYHNLRDAAATKLGRTN